MIISKETYNTFRQDPETIGTTLKNSYFPYYVRHVAKHVHDQIYLYHKPRMDASGVAYTRYGDFFLFLKSSLSIRTFHFTYGNEDYYVYVMKGIIFTSQGKILACLATNNLDMNISGGKFINPKAVRLYISTDFLLKSEYKNVYRRFDKEYITWCHYNEVEVVYSTSNRIEEELYSNDFALEFNSITELNELLTAENIETAFEWPAEEVEDSGLPF